MNFGLEPYIHYVLYMAAIGAFLLSVFWKPITGIFYLLPLIPLQTLRYRTNDLPLGSSIVGIILVGVALGLWRKGRPILPKSRWTRLLIVYGLFTYLSLCLGSTYLGQPFPLFGDHRFGVWQEYMVMPALLLLTLALEPSKQQMRAIVLIACLGTLALDKSFWSTVSDRDYSSYSEELHMEGGSMGYAGTNGLAAFAAQSAMFIFALGTFEHRGWQRWSYYGIAVLSSVCLLYSLSRAGYAAFIAGCFVIGVLKQRKLLALLIIFLLTWTTVVPPAVRQRVEMTYDPQTGSMDVSSSTRLSLWHNAFEVFNRNPLFGTGFNTYEYMHLNKRTDGAVGYYADTHNYFVKVLTETGVVGFVLLLWILGCMLFEGFYLFRKAREAFFASLGLGLIGWVVCAIVANLFGDRWTFLQVNGYMWVFAGLVRRACTLEKNAAARGQEIGVAALYKDPAVPMNEPSELVLAGNTADRSGLTPDAQFAGTAYRL
jgi:putative inorganic carbon (hco3(-)) transporter